MRSTLLRPGTAVADEITGTSGPATATETGTEVADPATLKAVTRYS